jgi:hypothetical protein
MWSRTGPIEDAVETFRLAQDKSKGVFRVVVGPQPRVGRLRVRRRSGIRARLEQTRREAQKSVAVPGELRSLSATDASAVSTSAQHVRAGVDAQPDIPNPGLGSSPLRCRRRRLTLLAARSSAVTERTLVCSSLEKGGSCRCWRSPSAAQGGHKDPGQRDGVAVDAELDESTDRRLSGLVGGEENRLW